MYHRFSYCRPLAWVGLLLSLTAAARDARCSDAPAEQGLDLIVLVDVSASMYTQLRDRNQNEDYPSGSDPERIRWDAVKLVSDLLTPEDRLLVQRFNHECPPNYVTRTGWPSSHLESEGDLPRRPLKLEDDFPLQYSFMRDKQRADLERRIAVFNTTSDWRGSTDQGETRIFDALNLVANRLGPPVPGRATHVILLTDGVDNEYQAGRFRTEESLRTAMRHYTGDLPGRDPIPIHTIGLGLFPAAANDEPQTRTSAEDETCIRHARDNSDLTAEGPLAEELLLRMASLTNGNYYRADTNRELIGVFLSLIRDLKGAWYQNHLFHPRVPGETRAIAPTPVQGIVDLGMLAYELNPPTAGVKHAIAPTAKPVSHHWIGLASHPAPTPVRRSGKDGTLYEQIYFGRTSGGEAAKSPFSDLPPIARLAISLHGEERPQNLVIIKRTQSELFTMTHPAEGANYHRYQHLRVQVAMAESAFFRPDQFELTARLLCAGGVAADEPRSALQEQRLALLPGTDRFQGTLRLLDLPRSGNEVDYYMLVVTVKGKPDLDNSLGGFQRDLPARTIAVANQLALQPVTPLELTESNPNGVVAIATAIPIDEPLTLHARFEPFQQDNRPVPLDGFVFATRQGPISGANLTLTRGEAQIALGFRRGAKLPQGGIVYEPGRIVIAGDERLGVEPLEIPVRLRLALARIAIDRAQLLLEATPTPVASQVAHVRLQPPDQARTEIGELQATIRPTTGSDSEDAAATFSPGELWLQAKGEPLARDGRSQTISFRLDEPFQAFLHPDGSKPAGKYLYEILVTGSGVDSARTPLIVSVDVPTLELESTEATIHADPGSTGFAEIPLRLQGIGREPLPIHIPRPKGKATFTFVNEDPQAETRQVELSVECPQPSNPLLLAWPTETDESTWNSLPFRVHVPAEMPFGRYRCEMLITGEKVADRQLTLRLNVNALLVEVPSASEDGQMAGWDSPSEITLLQFLGHDMKKTIRVRTGLGDSIPPRDLQVTPQAPFADESGDAMLLPRVVSVEQAGDGLQVTLLFPATPNAHVERPYRAWVQLVCPERHLRPVQVPFRVRFWTPEQFFEPAAQP